jgi:hypothetical protein
VGLALFVGTAAMLDFRLTGVALRQVPVSQMVARLFPWIAAGFVVMAGSGSLLFFSNPVVYYGNVFFRIKMALLVLAGANAWVFHYRLYPGVAQWDEAAVPPRRIRRAGAISLALWAALIMAGRLIYYDQYWFG